MSILESSFNGARLKAARQYNAMTIGDVAKFLDVTNQSISQFENNKIDPKPENLFALCNLLGFPREYFFEEDSSKITIGNTYFRSLSSTAKKDRNAQVEKVKLVAKIFEGIEEYISFPAFDLESSDNMDAEELAKMVREQWNLGGGPIYNIIDVMESHGVVITSAFENSKGIDAYSHVEVINKKAVPIVVLGYEKNAFRQQFNAAHELGHILTDGVFDVEEMSKAEYKNMENLMNQFSGTLLIPKDMYLKDLYPSGKTDIKLYIELKKKYRVSAAALIVRAYQLNAITANQYQYLMKQMSQHGYRLEEPYDMETPICKPRYLKHAMKMIIEDKNVSGSEFISTLKSFNLSLHKGMIEKLIGLEEGYLGDNNHTGTVHLLNRA
jgi:Zn-dependent peptidase ImmA (M78 family)/DNA-binding XRE family transcriptional regulator